MLTMLAFILVIGIIIFVHELGHFLAAKSVGIRVETFSLGYPPKMIGKQVGETEYRVGWIPLGGYVKMAGMIDESMDGGPSITGAPWEFQSKNTWQKLWVICAGVLMNLLLGVVLYTGIAVVKGLPEASGAAVVGGLTPGWPAEAAGLAPGDRIVAIAGMAIENWDDLLEQIHPRAGQEIELVYERGEERHEVLLTPEAHSVEVDGVSQEQGLIGIGPEIVFRRGDVGEVLFSGVYGTTNVIVLVATNVWKLITFKVSVRELGGPLIIAKMSGESARRGLVYLVSFIALISINIGCLNLLPIPALDGGQALIIICEGVARRQMPLRVRIALQQVGMVLILGLIVLIIVNDVQRVVDFGWLKNLF
ncbi:MAG: RIP metalloprotease RseP [Candidatus Eisenbacteria sp.]|nr:RIP metalloprotease RseP [Candidatus Eisenbacteria bacterium]